MNNSKGFLFFYDWLKAFSNLDGDEFKKLFFAMVEFQRDGKTPPKFEGTAEIIADFVFPQLERRIESSKCGKEGAKKRYQNKEANTSPDSTPNSIPNRDTVSTRQDKTKTRQKQDKNTPPQSPKGDESEIERKFSAFWDAYPKKEAKKSALKSYSKLNPDDELHNIIMKAVNAQKKRKQWQESKYIPLASSWLNGRRWEDEIQEAEHQRIDTLPTNVSILEKYF